MSRLSTGRYRSAFTKHPSSSGNVSSLLSSSRIVPIWMILLSCIFVIGTIQLIVICVLSSSSSSTSSSLSSFGGSGSGSGSAVVPGTSGIVKTTTATTTVTTRVNSHDGTLHVSSNNMRRNMASMEQQVIDNHDDRIDLRQRLPPSIWTLAGQHIHPTNNNDNHNNNNKNNNHENDNDLILMVRKALTEQEISKSMELCGSFLYSTLQRAVRVSADHDQTYVATGDIDSMWTRDSAVQMGLYMGRIQHMSGRNNHKNNNNNNNNNKNEDTNDTTEQGQLSQLSQLPQPWLRLVVEGAIRKQAFNMIQDPYANAYTKAWVDPSKLSFRERVIGRGGWVATRNYELDSGAYFLTQLYDYYVADHGLLYHPEALLQQTLIYDAVSLIIDVWIIEQHHEQQSSYRYFELPREGLGTPTTYTGMTWTGFRPSDDACQYGYLIPANIHAAAALERILELNTRIWNSNELATKATKLLHEIEHGIRTYGTISVSKNSGIGAAATADEQVQIYAYEVDGLGNVLTDFDDANVPSLLSIPLLGWSNYDRQIYRATRNRLLSPDTNQRYYHGRAFRGIGSPHTPLLYVWPMAFAIEALTMMTLMMEDTDHHDNIDTDEMTTNNNNRTTTTTTTFPSFTKEEVAQELVFQIRQSLASACHDAMHEGVHSEKGCKGGATRKWFEWANALFVVLVETALGERCDAVGQTAVLKDAAAKAPEKVNPRLDFFSNQYHNDHHGLGFYQGIAAQVQPL